jgi:hypothetical protein
MWAAPRLHNRVAWSQGPAEPDRPVFFVECVSRRDYARLRILLVAHHDVISNSHAESGRERDLTMHVDRRRRKQDGNMLHALGRGVATLHR